MSQFIALFYAVTWLTCTSAANAFANDRTLYCKLKQYGQLDEGVAKTALLVLNRHLCYMTSELAPLALFSDLLSGSEMQEAADKFLQCNPNLIKGKPEFPQLRSTDDLNLAIFTNEKSWLLFSFFERSYSFWLATSVELWPNDEVYKTVKLVVQSLNIVNDAAERCIKLTQDFSAILSKNDKEKQNILQCVEYPRKQTYLTKEQSLHQY